MFIERINRLNFLNKIAKQVFASENLIQKDMFTEAEKELPFKIKWVKKIWDEGSLSFDGYNDPRGLRWEPGDGGPGTSASSASSRRVPS